MSEELKNLVDDILKEKLKLHYENEELEAQGKLIKELCKEIEKLHSIIKEAIEYIEKNAITNISWLGTKATTKELFKDNASLYELLEILRGEE